LKENILIHAIPSHHFTEIELVHLDFSRVLSHETDPPLIGKWSESVSGSDRIHDSHRTIGKIGVNLVKNLSQDGDTIRLKLDDLDLFGAWIRSQKK